MTEKRLTGRFRAIGGFFNGFLDDVYCKAIELQEVLSNRGGGRGQPYRKNNSSEPFSPTLPHDTQHCERDTF